MNSKNNILSKNGKLEKIPNLKKLKNEINKQNEKIDKIHMKEINFLYSHEIMFNKKILLNKYCHCIIIHKNIIKNNLKIFNKINKICNNL